MARQSRSSRAKAMRVARQARQGPFLRLGCERCGDDSGELRLVGTRMLCTGCVNRPADRWEPSDD